MKGKYCIFLLFILVALMSCNDPKPVTDTLHRAEALMNEEPDSAWTLLNTISPDEMGQNRNRALYALLYTQAQDKTYRDETNDSLISVAVDYYRDTDDVRRKFLSYYYKGRVHFTTKDYLGAMTCYMEAEQLADEVGDDYLVGLLYAELGRIYNIYYDYPKSLEAYQKAAECYERAGKIRHRNYMWLNQGLVCRNLDRFDESERLLRMVLDSAQGKGDDTLIKSCMGNLVLLYIEEKRMQEAQELYVALESVAGINYGSASFKGVLSQMYASKDGYVEALSLLERGWACAEERMDSVNLYISSSALLAKQGKNDLAYQELLKGVTLQNKEAKQTLQQPVLTAQRDYLSEKLEFEAYKLRMEKRLRILYILLFALAIVMVVYVLSRKLKKEKEKARKTIDELNHEMLQRDKESRHKIASLLEELEDKDKSASASILCLRSELQKQEEDYHRYIKEAEELQYSLEDKLSQKTVLMADLFKNWFASMSKLLSVLVQNGKEETKNKKLRKEVTIWQEKYYEGNKAYREVEKLVNRYNDDAMLHFRQEMKWTEETDYRRVCYFFAGFSIHLIAILMEETEDSIYQKRHRLRKYLETSDLLHKDLYLALLGK
jgi:tetratricopeptide (TPR) repeat protein